MRESLKVLNECAKVQEEKSHDYQNPKSGVRQIDYYPKGLWSIYEEINKKSLRLRSLLESGCSPKNESLEDNAKDLINYASYFVEYARGKMAGQAQNEEGPEQLLLELNDDVTK